MNNATNTIELNARDINGNIVLWYGNGFLVDGRNGTAMNPIDAMLIMRADRRVAVIAEKFGVVREEVVMRIAQRIAA